MLLATMLIVIVQIVVAVAAPVRFVYLALWIQSIPYSWNWNAQVNFDTPIGPLNIIGIQYFGFVLACALAVMPRLDRALSEIVNYKWHVAFIGFCVLSLTYAPSMAYGFRMVVKLLGPFLFMIVTLNSVTTKDDLVKMQHAIIGSGLIIVTLALGAKVGGLNSNQSSLATGLTGLGPPGMGPAVFSAHMLPVAMLTFSAFLCRRSNANLLLALLSALAVIGALQRTSAAALYVGFSVILFYGAKGVWRFIAPIAALLGIPALLVFNDTFRRRMFFGDSTPNELLGNPSKALESVNGSGRFELWKNMLERFFAPHPIRGSGIGATEDFLYSHAAGGAGVVHSEYVRLLCEVGVIGLVLFTLAAISYLWRLRRYAEQSKTSSGRVLPLAAIGSVVAYLVYCSTDNAFDYIGWFGIYVFALVAGAVKDSVFASEIPLDTTVPRRASARFFPNLLH